MNDAQRLILSLLQQPENRICADCKSKKSEWASTTLGVFVCIDFWLEILCLRQTDLRRDRETVPKGAGTFERERGCPGAGGEDQSDFPAAL